MANFGMLRVHSANLSSARRAEKYQVDRLVLKAMADESPKARYQAAKRAGRSQRVEDNAFHLHRA